MAEEKSILVVGGGISGITTAVEAAEVGYKVILLEKSPYLGGRVAKMNKYFPKLCPPSCGLEINFKRIKQNNNIKILTQAEIENISGQAGDYDVTVKLSPRLVNEKCTSCNKCVDVCPVERSNEFNYGMDKTRAIYLPHEMAFPLRYVIDSDVCEGAECGKCVEVCDYKAIDLDMKPETRNIKAGSIVYATGWKPFDAASIENFEYDKQPNVITNVMMERLAASNGPTKGKIVRPSDGKEIESIAFVQCAGSRDENYLPYCSTVCCLASLKQAIYVREQYPDSKVYIFYIDLRALGKYETFYQQVQKDENIIFHKGKIAKIAEYEPTDDLIVEGEDTISGNKIKEKVNMVVLATGMAPSIADSKIPSDITYDEFGFVFNDLQKAGIYAAGVAKKPVNVASSIQDATGMALKAIQCVRR